LAASSFAPRRGSLGDLRSGGARRVRLLIALLELAQFVFKPSEQALAVSHDRNRVRVHTVSADALADLR